jgi:DNA-binding NarL/FixJ family response regulator
LERALFNLIASGSSFSPRPPSIADLTPREHQLTSLLAQGLANKEIAGRLNLSLQTVKNHVHSILQKTQSKNRAMFAQLVGSSVPMGGTHEKLESHLPLSSST